MGARRPAPAGRVLRRTSRSPALPRNFTEILLQLGDRPDLSTRQAWMTTHLLAKLGDLLKESKATVFWIYAPAASPPTLAQDTDEVRLSVAPCIRIGLANNPGQEPARIAFETAACALAEQYGLGFSLSEGRASFGMRYWNEVLPYSTPDYSMAREALTGQIPADQVQGQLMLTLIGPTSSRTVDNLRRLAHLFAALDVGVLAVSIWQMHQTTFVHLLVATLTPAPAERDPGTGPAIANNPASYLLQACRLSLHAQPALASLQWPPDLQIVLADHASMPHRPAADGRVVPFWVTWDVPQSTRPERSPAVETLTRLLVDAFNDHIPDTSDRDLRKTWVTFVRAKRHADERGCPGNGVTGGAIS